MPLVPLGESCDIEYISSSSSLVQNVYINSRFDNSVDELEFYKDAVPSRTAVPSTYATENINKKQNL